MTNQAASDAEKWISVTARIAALAELRDQADWIPGQDRPSQYGYYVQNAITAAIAEKEARIAELELQLAAIGDLAVADHDSETVGKVDAIVKELAKYKDRLRALFVDIPRECDQLREQLQQAESTLANLNHERNSFVAFCNTLPREARPILVGPIQVAKWHIENLDALRKNAVDNVRWTQECADKYRNERDAAQAELKRAREERDKLAAFKAYVHKRLDDAGVPLDPESTHKAEGCRIGGRLDVIFAERDSLAAEVERLKGELHPCPPPLQGFVPETYGDAVLARWITGRECENYEWDNRTTAENARWMLERLLHENAALKEQVEKLKEDAAREGR